MKIGIFSPLVSPAATPEFVAALGPACEQRGFASIWVGEHAVLFDEYDSHYPYAEDGRLPAAGRTGFLEPFTALSFVAAETRTIRLGTGVCLLPQRNPVYTAKQVATLDWLAGGRVDFGIGIGWLAEEFAALSVPFERRAARCREYVEVMRSLWRDATSGYQGEFYTLPACRQYPKPAQKPHPPIHVGGNSDAALARVAAYGDGWYGYGLDPEAAGERVRRLGAELERHGRALEDVDVSVCAEVGEAPNRGLLERYRDAGVEQVVLLVMPAALDGFLAELDRCAEELVGAAADL